MAKTQVVIVPWPMSGVREATALVDNPQQYTVRGINVRTYDPATDRSRGAQRPGLTDLVAIDSSGDIQHIAQVLGDPNVPALAVGADTVITDSGGVPSDPGIIAAATF